MKDLAIFSALCLIGPAIIFAVHFYDMWQVRRILKRRRDHQ